MNLLEAFSHVMQSRAGKGLQSNKNGSRRKKWGQGGLQLGLQMEHGQQECQIIGNSAILLRRVEDNEALDSRWRNLGICIPATKYHQILHTLEDKWSYSKDEEDEEENDMKKGSKK